MKIFKLAKLSQNTCYMSVDLTDNALNKQNQQKFTTFDVDNDHYQPGNCGSHFLEVGGITSVF